MRRFPANFRNFVVRCVTLRELAGQGFSRDGMAWMGESTEPAWMRHRCLVQLEESEA